jgi:hypothetical protein
MNEAIYTSDSKDLSLNPRIGAARMLPVQVYEASKAREASMSTLKAIPQNKLSRSNFSPQIKPILTNKVSTLLAELADAAPTPA